MPLLFANPEDGFSHVKAHMVNVCSSFQRKPEQRKKEDRKKRCWPPDSDGGILVLKTIHKVYIYLKIM